MVIKGFCKLLELLVRARWIAGSSADCTAKRYKQLIKDDKVYLSMKTFAINERIDDLFIGLSTTLPFSTGDQKDVVKKNYYFVIILSHRNSCMELGFSINEQMLERNMKDQSLVPQRIL